MHSVTTCLDVCFARPNKINDIILNNNNIVTSTALQLSPSCMTANAVTIGAFQMFRVMTPCTCSSVEFLQENAY
jgi:hypothetical protein